MPKELEAKLRRSGRKKGFVGKQLDKYVYGALNKLGLIKGNKPVKKAKYQRSK